MAISSYMCFISFFFLLLFRNGRVDKFESQKNTESEVAMPSVNTWEDRSSTIVCKGTEFVAIGGSREHVLPSSSPLCEQVVRLSKEGPLRTGFIWRVV